MQNLFGKILALAGVALAAGCQTDGGGEFEPVAGNHGKGSFAPPSQNPAATGDIGRSGLIPREQTRQTLHNFKEAYLKLGSPHFLVYVNREGSEARGDGPDHVSDIEQSFGKTLRLAGAELVDQKTANAMMVGKWLKAPTSSGDAKASRDRDSLQKIADVGIEILADVPSAAAKDTSGEKKASLPAIQATAIRLEDARIIGQASTANLSTGDRQFDARDASEAVALLLMQDLIREAK